MDMNQLTGQIIGAAIEVHNGYWLFVQLRMRADSC